MTLSPYLTTLVSGVRADATAEVFDVPTRGRAGLILTTDVSAAAGAFSLTVKVEGLDPSSGKTWTIVQGVAVTGVDTAQVLRIRPGITPAANLAVADVLPATVRVTVTHTDATSITRTHSVQLTG